MTSRRIETGAAQQQKPTPIPEFISKVWAFNSYLQSFELPFRFYISTRKVPDCHEEPSCSISLFSRPFCLSFIVGYFLPVGIAFVQFTEYYGYLFHFLYFLSLIFCCAFDSGLLICGSSFRTAHRVLRISFSFFLLPFVDFLLRLRFRAFYLWE